MRVIQFWFFNSLTELKEIHTSFLPCLLSDAADEIVFIVSIIKSIIFAWSILLSAGMHH
jgi:hypothetical protein